MPTKNRLESLKLAVNSVLAQTHSDFELIVVDDGSTDSTESYMRSLMASDSRIIYVKNEVSKGAPYCRNLGILRAKGEFVTGLDDDDEFKPNHLKGLLEYWQLLEKNLTTPFSCIFTQDLTRNGHHFIEGQKRSHVNSVNLFEYNAIGNQIFAPKQRFIDAGLFNEKMPAWQDLEFYYRFLKAHGPARLLDIHSYVFDVTPRSDRISVGQKNRILEAYRLMTHHHAKHSRRYQQQLLLQVYSDYYGFDVNLWDYAKFMAKGFWLSGYKNLAKLMLRRKYRHLRGIYRRKMRT
jgi:glycosyltransferase involved in cell wall biosynthesis